jgi:hypothetical protein
MLLQLESFRKERFPSPMLVGRRFDRMRYITEDKNRTDSKLDLEIVRLLAAQGFEPVALSSRPAELGERCTLGPLEHNSLNQDIRSCSA